MVSKFANQAQYLAALRAHDWHYEASDDFQVWRRGKRERVELLQAQPLFDPDWALWTQVAPPEYWK